MRRILALAAALLLAAPLPADAGKLLTTSGDLARAQLGGTFSGTGRSAYFTDPRGLFNLSISGIVSATVRLERSFDGGTTWKIVQSYTADAEDQWSDPEPGAIYSLNCSVYGSGTIVYRMSR